MSYMDSTKRKTEVLNLAAKLFKGFDFAEYKNQFEAYGELEIRGKPIFTRVQSFGKVYNFGKLKPESGRTKCFIAFLKVFMKGVFGNGGLAT